MVSVMKCCCAVVLALAVPALADSPFATSVVGYVQGTNATPGFTTPSVAVGQPTRFTGEGVFPGAVTPFNAPFMPSEIVSIGEGGSLTLAFDHAITNNPQNHFGLDLLIFGNTFYIDGNWPQGIAAGLFGAGGVVEVGTDLDTWFPVPGVLAVGNYPTLGYSDLTDPYATTPGSVLSDFTLPVNPGFNAIGMNFAQIVAGYNGSGGGTGIDIGLAGVGSIQYVRISNPVGSGAAIQVDGVSAVAPAPGVWSALIGLGVIGAGRRARISR